jgi:hypothetical protein
METGQQQQVKVRTKLVPTGPAPQARILQARFSVMPLSSSPAALAHRPELAGLRALAMGIVLVQH